MPGKEHSLIPPGAEVAPFDPPALKGREMPTYGQIKSTFDPGAMPKQNRFALSDLVAGQLSVEQEEQRRFEGRVNEEVESRLKILRSEVHAAAHAKGLEEGRAKAYDEEKARIAQHLEGLMGATQSIIAAKEKLADQYEQTLVDIAFRIARVVVHKELEIQPAAIQATVAAILDKIAKEDDVRVRLSSHEFEAIDTIKSEVDRLGRSGRVTFEIDATLKPGNCIVESLSGEIASFLEEKFELLKTEIDKVRATQRREGTGG